MRLIRVHLLVTDIIKLIILRDSRYVWRRRDRDSWHSFDGVILRFSANNGHPCRRLGAANLVRSRAAIHTGIPCGDLGQRQLDRAIVVQGHHCSSARTQTNSVPMPRGSNRDFISVAFSRVELTNLTNYFFLFTIRYRRWDTPLFEPSFAALRRI